MKKKKLVSILLCFCMLLLTACQTSTSAQNQDTAIVEADTTSDTTESDALLVSTVSMVTGEYSQEEIDAKWDESTANKIQFNGTEIDFSGTGATTEGSTITITSSGTYVLSGLLEDGQVVVDAGDEDNVYLVLNSVNLTSTTSAPLYIKNAKNTYLTLATDTVNTITDGDEYVYEDSSTDEPNAAIYSSDDLIINGSGSLTVIGNYNNGITCKDDLKIVDGTLLITAADDGIVGKDSITIRTGTITINSGGDAFKASNSNDTSKGYIIIDGGTFNLTSGSDGFQAETSLIVNNGMFDVTTNGGSANASTKNTGEFNEAWGQNNGMANRPQRDTTETGSAGTEELPALDTPPTTDSGSTASNTPPTNDMPTGDTTVEGTITEDVATEDTVSAKAFKSGVDLIINGGTFIIDSCDDSIHSNSTIVITGGNINLSTGDDGIHADSSITIDDGTIVINNSYEGIESEYITINGGTIQLTASDDGINISGGNDDGLLTINGGTIQVEAGGDGLDANGSIIMNGGTVFVNGPTNGADGVIDYDKTFEINGGIFMAAGSTGMAMTPSESSTQASVVMVYDAVQEAGTLVHLASETGEEIATFSPAKQYQFIIISSPDLTNGLTSLLYSGGTYSSEEWNGIYSGGTYSGGTQIESFSITDIINANTDLSNITGGMGGQGGRGGRGSMEGTENPGFGGTKGNPQEGTDQTEQTTP